MSSDGNALLTQIVAQFFERRRAGERPSIQDLADAAGRPKLDERLRTQAVLEIARAARERTKTLIPGSSDRAATFSDVELEPITLPEIDGYDVIDVLGRGGMGVVYEAYQRSTGRRVAVKFLLDADAARESSRRRFEREVDLVARLSHPNVASILDSGVHSGRYFYVMEYVAGLPLDEVLPPGKCDIRAALALLASICDAIDYAHQRGVLHRDLKPSNILVVEGIKSGGSRSDSSSIPRSLDPSIPSPKILDFGLAKAIDPTLESGAAKRTLSKPGQFVGTLAYVSPEQARGDYEQLCVRSDVYSLGAIAYELLAGQEPLSVDGSLREVLNRIAEVEPRKPSALRRELDRDLDAIILKSLEKSPQKRYATAADLAADIRRYLAGEPIAARPIGIGERVWRRIRRDKRVSVAIALGIAGVGATYAYGQYRVWVHREHFQRDLRSMGEMQARASAIDVEPLTQEGRNRLAVWESELDDYSDSPEMLSSYCESLGRLSLAYGDFERARRTLERARQTQIDAPELAGDRSRRLPLIDHELALAYYKLSRDGTANETLQKDVLPALRKLAAPKAPETARSVELATALCDLGRVLTSQDHCPDAEKQFLSALDMHRSLVNPVGEADTRVHYSYCLDRMSRLGESAEQLTQALGVYQQRYADQDSATIAFTLLNLGNNQRRTEQYADARNSLKVALAMYERLYPAGHPQAVVCMNHIMLTEKEMGNYPDAVRMAEEALRRRIAAYPDNPDHDFIAISHLNYGQALTEVGRYADAEREIATAQGMWERQPNPAGSHKYATALHSMADLYRRTGRRDEALALCEQALQVRQKINGDKPHLDVAASHYLRARILLDDDDPTNAELALDAAVTCYEKIPGLSPYYWRTMLAKYWRGECRFRLDRLDEAEQDINEAFRVLQAARPWWTDPTPLDACRRYVELLEHREKPDEAEINRKRCPDER